MTPETQLEMFLREVGRKPTTRDLAEISALRKVHGLSDTERVWISLVSATFDRSILRADLARNADLVTKSVGQATGALTPAVQQAVDRIATGTLAQHRLRWNVLAMATGAFAAALMFMVGTYYGAGLSAAHDRHEIVFHDLIFLFTGPAFLSALVVALVMWNFISHAIGLELRQIVISSILSLMAVVALGFYICAPYVPNSMYRPCVSSGPIDNQGFPG